MLIRSCGLQTRGRSQLCDFSSPSETQHTQSWLIGDFHSSEGFEGHLGFMRNQIRNPPLWWSALENKSYMLEEGASYSQSVQSG